MSDVLIAWGELGLFVMAFLAATLLPLSSEVLLLALLQKDYFSPVGLWFWASTGNVLGSVVNYALGFWLGQAFVAKWLRLSDAQFDKAEARYRRYGVWALLLAWVPIIGDPITLVAGLLRVNFWLFLCLVGLAKGARYGLLVYFAL